MHSELKIVILGILITFCTSDRCLTFPDVTLFEDTTIFEYDSGNNLVSSISVTDIAVAAYMQANLIYKGYDTNFQVTVGAGDWDGDACFSGGTCPGSPGPCLCSQIVSDSIKQWDVIAQCTTWCETTKSTWDVFDIENGQIQYVFVTTDNGSNATFHQINQNSWSGLMGDINFTVTLSSPSAMFGYYVVDSLGNAYTATNDEINDAGGRDLTIPGWYKEGDAFADALNTNSLYSYTTFVDGSIPQASTTTNYGYFWQLAASRSKSSNFMQNYLAMSAFTKFTNVNLPGPAGVVIVKFPLTAAVTISDCVGTSITIQPVGNSYWVFQDNQPTPDTFSVFPILGTDNQCHLGATFDSTGIYISRDLYDPSGESWTGLDTIDPVGSALICAPVGNTLTFSPFVPGAVPNWLVLDGSRNLFFSWKNPPVNDTVVKISGCVSQNVTITSVNVLVNGPVLTNFTPISGLQVCTVVVATNTFQIPLLDSLDYGDYSNPNLTISSIAQPITQTDVAGFKTWQLLCYVTYGFTVLGDIGVVILFVKGDINAIIGGIIIIATLGLPVAQFVDSMCLTWPVPFAVIYAIISIGATVASFYGLNLGLKQLSKYTSAKLTQRKEKKEIKEKAKAQQAKQKFEERYAKRRQELENKPTSFFRRQSVDEEKEVYSSEVKSHSTKSSSPNTYAFRGVNIPA